MTSVHLYEIPTVVQLTVADTGAPNMNYPVNRTDIKIFRNVRNTVEVYAKDFDRKAVDLTGKTITARVLDRRAQKTLLTRTVTVIDATKGAYKFLIDPVDCAEWRTGMLEYTVTVTDSQNHDTFLFHDRDRSPFGVLEMLDGPLMQATDPITVNHSSFLMRDGRLFSGAVAGAANVGNTSGVHTAAFYMNMFTGSVSIQASLDMQPTSDDSGWFNVDSRDMFENSSVEGFNFTGNYLWVRFVADPILGTFSKVVYRN
jgi:hypothetical protein